MSNQRRGEAEVWLSHERPGYNYRMDELSAALGVTCMSRFVDVIWGGDEAGGDEPTPERQLLERESAVRSRVRRRSFREPKGERGCGFLATARRDAARGAFADCLV